MKTLLLISTILASTAQAAPKCVDLTGTYTMPQSKEDFVEGFNNWLEIDQKECVGMEIAICTGSACPIVPAAVFDDKKPSEDGTIYSIVGNTIVLKPGPTVDLGFQTSKHGYCKMHKLILSLDPNRDMILSTPKTYDCDDKFTGPYVEHAPRKKN
jgi:hypothetical protein